LLAAVVLAALPTAPSGHTFSSRYERGETMARDTVLLTTILAIPVLVIIAALLA
jgi:predicted permease